MTELAGVLSLDLATSRALHDVDALAEAHPDEAADLLKRTAMPRARDALAAGEALHVRTAWGERERTAVVGIARDREQEMSSYAAALASGRREDLLEVLTRQIAIEKRAADVLGEVQRGP